ncbi:formylglycine-generating enzyme family protein, partial [bacterium]|nr:formylglycine-generating enzyme family protein [candidate division CSSED10-310 bacterium]
MAHPVGWCTWCEALVFANVMSVQNGFNRCYYTDGSFTTPITPANYTTGPFHCDFDADGYRLPTEGEWEYFCRAGTTGPFSCTEPNYNVSTCAWQSCTLGTLPTFEQHAVFCANKTGGPDVVGTKLPNPWNLLDIHGNSTEWCWDWDGTYPTGSVTDYTGAASGTVRVARSGYWSSQARVCKSAARWGNTITGRRDFQGIRLVRMIP